MILSGDKPVVAVSACLAGEAVRYDGQHKHMPVLLDSLRQHLELSSVCPESAAGLGVPREPMHLVMSDNKVMACGVENAALDFTDALDSYSQRWLQQNQDVCGAVLKARSPSCGFMTTPIYSGANVERYGNGLFADALHTSMYAMPVIDEENWFDKAVRAVFVKQLMFVWRWKQSSVLTTGGLQSLHAAYKYLLMAHNAAVCTELGRVAANSSEKNITLRSQLYYEGVLSLLSRSPERGHYVNALQHMAGYLQKGSPWIDGVHQVIDEYASGCCELDKVIECFQQALADVKECYLLQQFFLFPLPLEKEWVYAG